MITVKSGTIDTELVREYVEDGIDDIFFKIVKRFKLKAGDLSPLQVDNLDKLEDELTHIMTLFIVQNKSI